MKFITLSSIIIVNLTIDAKQIFDTIRSIVICILKHKNWQFEQINLEHRHDSNNGADFGAMA